MQNHTNGHVEEESAVALAERLHGAQNVSFAIKRTDVQFTHVEHSHRAAAPEYQVYATAHCSLTVKNAVTKEMVSRDAIGHGWSEDENRLNAHVKAQERAVEDGKRKCVLEYDVVNTKRAAHGGASAAQSPGRVSTSGAGAHGSASSSYQQQQKQQQHQYQQQ